MRQCSICGTRIPQVSHDALEGFGYIVMEEEDLIPIYNAPADAFPFYFCAKHTKSEISLWLHETIICSTDRLKRQRPRLLKKIKDAQAAVAKQTGQVQAGAGGTGDY